MEKSNQERDSITIRITGKEITSRLSCLEADMRMVKRFNYVQFAILIMILGKAFFF